MTRPCKYEQTIICSGEQIKTLFHRIEGNGEKGLGEKIDELYDKINELSSAIIEIKSYNKIKNWVMGATIAILTSVCTFLATELYNKIN
jgi:hypothetical protein